MDRHIVRFATAVFTGMFLGFVLSTVLSPALNLSSTAWIAFTAGGGFLGTVTGLVQGLRASD